MASDIFTASNFYEIMLDNKEKIGCHRGFTIPFIIGAYYNKGFLENKDLESEKCISILLDLILENVQQGNEVVLLKCTGNNEPILQYLSEQSPKNIAHIKTYDNLKKKIYLGPSFYTKTIEDVTTELWNKYGKYISAHLFSIKSIDNWETFDNRETKFIDNPMKYVRPQ